MAAYYRRFVKKFADIAKPLTKLTRKNTTFEWTDDSQTAFVNLKRAVEEATTLSFPYPNIPCIVDSDASDVAIGAVLSQVIEGVERPIARPRVTLPSGGGLNVREITKYSDFRPFEGYILEMVQHMM